MDDFFRGVIDLVDERNADEDSIAKTNHLIEEKFAATKPRKKGKEKGNKDENLA